MMMTKVVATGLSTSAVLLIMAGMAASRPPEADDGSGTQPAVGVPAEPVKVVVIRKPVRQVRPAPAAAPVHSTSRAS